MLNEGINSGDLVPSAFSHKPVEEGGAGSPEGRPPPATLRSLLPAPCMCLRESDGERGGQKGRNQPLP